MVRHRTSMTVPDGTLDRIKTVKPFDSMSHSEFVEHLLDVYESQDATTAEVEERGDD